MNQRKAVFGLPLLAKELIEQSARRRTYVIRSVYAILFFSFAMMIFWGSIYSEVSTPFDLLGRGREMFMTLMVLQIFGVALFTPALTCGTISSEKERNTIGLLFLTKLGPTAILLEKYLGRLFLMGTYLLISLPLFGFCYTLGGVEQSDVWFGFYGLIVTVLQLAALGLLCSCYCRTTVGAFIASYLIGLAMFFGPAFFYELAPRSIANDLMMPVWHSVASIIEFLGYFGLAGFQGTIELLGGTPGDALKWNPNWVEFSYGGRTEVGFVFFTPILIFSASESVASSVSAWQFIGLGFPALYLTGLFLLFARLILVQRAFASPKRYVLLFFQLLDRLFHKANQNRITKGIVLIKEHSSLPVDDPIAWRETTKTTLGSFRYLLRIFLVIEVPVLVVCLISVAMSGGSVYQSHRSGAVVAVNLLCWVIAILLTVVRSASLVAGERSHETLDVLLTTPISSREFVLQKYRGVKKLLLVVSVPLLTGIVMQGWYCSITQSSVSYRVPVDHNAFFYLCIQASSVFIYLHLFAWISLLFGMWMKTSTRAILASFACIVGWMVVPLVFLVIIFEAWGVSQDSFTMMSLVSSPLFIPFFNEIGELDDPFSEGMILPTVILNHLLYTILLYSVRSFALKKAADLLGRSEDDWS